MRSTRSSKFVNLAAFLALGLSLSAGLGQAQEASYTAKLTIPFEARLGSVMVPSGDYTVTMSTAASPHFTYVRGEGKTFIFNAVSADPHATSDRNILTFVYVGGTYGP
jgi:hypothetical protein